MKKTIIIFLLLTAVLIFGCAKSIPVQETVVVEPSQELSAEPEVSAQVPASEIIIEETTPLVNLSCTLTTDCEDGKQCIDGECGTVAQLFKTDCERKCNFEEVIISTSDGDTYTLSKGQGSYTAAGALEWKLLLVPHYCPMEKVIVPLRIIAKNYSKIVGEYALTLREGETSGQIIHPAIPSVEFTVTLDKVKEECE